MEFLPHQIQALDKARPILKEKGVVVLALECRLGKTFIALQLASEVRNGGRILFVSKKNALGSIRIDSDRIGVEVVAINYESLHKIENKGFSVVIIDEFHRVGAYPKPCQAAKFLQSITGPAKCILLSATPSIESGAQLFHSFWVTNRGPWASYRSFYKWHKDFGIEKTIRISGGQEVKTYDDVRPEVLSHVLKYCVSMTQDEAGFSQKTKVVVHRIENKEVVSFGEFISKKGIFHFYENVVLAESPAASLQKAAMACGGTLINDDGKPFVHFFNPTAKIDFLMKKLDRSKQYAIFTQYIHERQFIIDSLKTCGLKCCWTIEELKNGDANIFVGSIKSYCEGIDLSWLSGAMVLYSLTFSGATYEQILNRMNKFDRKEEIKVHVLLIKDSIEEYIFKAVSDKKNFNGSFYKMVKNA